MGKINKKKQSNIQLLSLTKEKEHYCAVHEMHLTSIYFFIEKSVNIKTSLVIIRILREVKRNGASTVP